MELSQEDRAQATSSIERYFLDIFSQKIGLITAGPLLNFVLEGIAPCIGLPCRSRCQIAHAHESLGIRSPQRRVSVLEKTQ